jgi:hypothetical protein
MSFNHVGVTTIERLDQGHLYPNLEVPGLICPGRESNPGFQGGSEHSRKEPSRHLVRWLFGTSPWPEAGATAGPLHFYITVDFATTTLQNGACTYRCISKLLHYKPPFLQKGYIKSMEFYKTYITLFCLEKTNLLTIFNSEPCMAYYPRSLK